MGKINHFSAKKWTEEDVNTLRRMYRQGRSILSIALHMGRSVDACRTKLSKAQVGRADIEKPPPDLLQAQPFTELRPRKPVYRNYQPAAEPPVSMISLVPDKPRY